jgi:hypothetical protein
MAGTLTGGFIEFPDGKYSADPAGTFEQDKSTGTYRWLSTKQPQLVGSIPLLFYDRTMSRWLPTSREAVHPDGTRFAYVTWGPERTSEQTVHIVDIATGQERTFPAQHPLGARVFEYSLSGIYLSGGSEGAEVGLWFLDPQSGSKRLVTEEKIVYVVRDGKAWLGQRISSQPGSSPDTLVQLDLTSGTKTTWFHHDDALVWIVGLTSAGVPIVTARTAHGDEVWLVSSPGHEKRIYSGPDWFSFPIPDSHGIWFLSSYGVYLYSETGGVQKVSNLLGTPAGVCV